MLRALSLPAAVWPAAAFGFVRSLPAAFLFTLPAGVAAVPFALTGHRFGPEADNPWGLWFLWLAVLTGLLVPAFTALLRRGMGEREGRLFGLRAGDDEVRTLAALGLVLVLAFTVLGVAFLGFVCVVAALAVASRAAANAPELAVEAADRAPEIAAYFGTGEWIAVWTTGAAFALFGIWFATRLLLAFPETLRLKRVQAMAALALSRGHLAGVTLSGAGLAIVIAVIVAGLRAIPHGDDTSGLVVLFGISWAGLALVQALLASFLARLDAVLLDRRSAAPGTQP